MINLFFEGGVLFMSIISFFLIMTGVSFYTHSDKLKTYGNLGLGSGILGSFIGLYSAFEFIQQIGDVSPSILAGGIRVALICTLYGLLVLTQWLFPSQIIFVLLTVMNMLLLMML